MRHIPRLNSFTRSSVGMHIEDGPPVLIRRQGRIGKIDASRVAGRRLEQQPEQLPFRQSQQQQPV